VKYQIIKNGRTFIINLSGDTRKNESIILKKVFSPYFKERGIKVIVNLKKIEKVDLVTLLGVLTSIRKEIAFLKGELKLCSLKPEILNYFKENRLDHFFQIYEDEEKARKSERKEYEKNL